MFLGIILLFYYVLLHVLYDSHLLFHLNLLSEFLSLYLLIHFQLFDSFFYCFLFYYLFPFLFLFFFIIISIVLINFHRDFPFLSFFCIVLSGYFLNIISSTIFPVVPLTYFGSFPILIRVFCCISIFIILFSNLFIFFDFF